MPLNITINGQANLGVTTGIPATITVQMGVPGPGATVEVGTTTTGDAGTDAEVVNVGTLSAAILDFTIPRGNKGDQGPRGYTGEQGEHGYKGEKGDTGNAATISVSGTNTVPSDYPASVENFGTPHEAAFYFNIPHGAQGEQGEQGPKGFTGDTGAGVPFGGTAGQILAKFNSDNYNTHWIDQNASGVWGNITGTLSSQTDLYDALNGKLSLTGGIMSGAIRFDSVGTQNIAKGSFDSGRGGYNGISLNCAVDYELNWQAGYLKALNSGGFNVPINLESNIVLSEYGEYGLENKCELSLFGLNVFNDYGNSNLNLTPYGFGVTTDRGESLNINVDTGINGNGGDDRNLYYLNGNGFNGSNDSGEIFQLNKSNVKGAYVDLDNNLLNWSFGKDGLKFPDATIQSTAALPLTGGTVTGNVNFDSTIVWSDYASDATVTFGDSIIYQNNANQTEYSELGYSYIQFSNDSGTTTLDATGLTFPDATTQTTGFIPSKYITASNIASTYLTQSSASSTYQTQSGMSAYLSTSSAVANYLTISNASSTYLTQSSATSTYLTKSSAASTYFPIPAGTTSQYIRGDGSLAIYGPLGDRYLTSSTTSLTIGLGSKTLTVGTGLSYSALQELTIVFNSSNNMHASVTSYNSTTGVMVVYVSNKTGSGTYSAWTINVGGVIGGTYLEIGNNLSDLQSSSTARTNLGLTALATASFATTTESQAGTSTTTVVSPATLFDAKFFQGGKGLNVNSYNSITSGTGAVAGSIGMNALQVASPTTATGHGSRYGQIINSSRGLNYSGALDFSKRVTMGGRFQKQNATTDSNSVFRFYYGKSNTVGDMTIYDKGIGFRVAGSGALQLTVANSSVLTTTTSSFTPVQNQCYDVIITSDGAGNATMFVNGNSVATSTGSPTNSSGNNFFGIEAQNLAIISTPTTLYFATDLYAQVNV